MQRKVFLRIQTDMTNDTPLVCSWFLFILLSCLGINNIARLMSFPSQIHFLILSGTMSMWGIHSDGMPNSDLGNLYPPFVFADVGTRLSEC